MYLKFGLKWGLRGIDVDVWCFILEVVVYELRIRGMIFFFMWDVVKRVSVMLVMVFYYFGDC